MSSPTNLNSRRRAARRMKAHNSRRRAIAFYAAPSNPCRRPMADIGGIWHSTATGEMWAHAYGGKRWFKIGMHEPPVKGHFVPEYSEAGVITNARFEPHPDGVLAAQFHNDHHTPLENE